MHRKSHPAGLGVHRKSGLYVGIYLVSAPDPNQPQHGSLPVSRVILARWGWFGSDAETSVYRASDSREAQAHDTYQAAIQCRLQESTATARLISCKDCSPSSSHQRHCVVGAGGP